MQEFQDFGWNALTVSFLAMIFFGLLGAWGMIQQIKSIWKNKSGKSVSVTWFTFMTFMFLSSFYYGLEIKGVAMILQIVFRAPFTIIVLYGLHKYKGFTKLETTELICLSIAFVLMVTLFNGEKSFIVFNSLLVIASLKQPWEVWVNRSAGVVSLKLMAIGTSSSVFWIIYGFALDLIPIIMMASLYCIIYIATIGLCLYFGKNTQHELKTS